VYDTLSKKNISILLQGSLQKAAFFCAPAQRALSHDKYSNNITTFAADLNTLSKTDNTYSRIQTRPPDGITDSIQVCRKQKT